MKKIKILATIVFAFLASYSFAQQGDYAINISTIPGTAQLNETVTYQVQLSNLGALDYPANAVMATIQAPPCGKIIGFTASGANAGWYIYSISTTTNAGGGGNAVRLVNTVPLMAGTATLPNLIMQAVVVTDPVVEVFSASVGYNPFNGNSSSSGDLENNNNASQSSFKVTPGSSLPLDFLSVNAAWNINDATVNWEVAREMNNEYFSIERSFDGKSFTQVGTVRSIGNHEEAAKYNYVDKGVRGKTIDKVAYRVKQVDNNGRSTTSKIVFLTNKGKSNNAYIYPNPVTANKTFAFVYENNEGGSGDLIINILDAHGKLVYTTTMPIVKGKNETGINVSALAAGAYFLKYDNESLNINGIIRLIKD